MSTPDCLFCRIVAGEIPADVVATSETAVAFRDIAPQAPVHVLVVPKVHHHDIAQLAAEAPAVLAACVRLACEVAVSEGIDGSGWRLVTNTGADGGQTVFHTHLHVLGGRALGAFG